MPKIRGIKPDTWTDENFVELSPYARLVFIGLWNYCCDNGHVEDRPKQIKMRLLPADDVSAEDTLRELDAQGRITREDGWITVPTLQEHQRIDKRYFTTCDKPGCVKPGEESGDAERESRRGHDGDTTGTRRGHDVSPPRPRVDGDGDGDGDGDVMVSAAKPAPARKRAHQLPDDFAPNDTNRHIADERGVDLAAAFEQFRDHHQAKGSTFKDWHLAFNTWLRRERPSSRLTQPERHLPNARDLEDAPGGMTDEESWEWMMAQRRKRAAR